MLYRTVEQAANCKVLEARRNRALNDMRTWQRQSAVLRRKIDIERERIADFRRQGERTGDPEGFEPAIRQAESEIRRLQRQVPEANAKAKDSRDKAQEHENQMSRQGCRGFA